MRNSLAGRRTRQWRRCAASGVRSNVSVGSSGFKTLSCKRLRCHSRRVPSRRRQAHNLGRDRGAPHALQGRVQFRDGPRVVQANPADSGPGRDEVAVFG